MLPGSVVYGAASYLASRASSLDVGVCKVVYAPLTTWFVCSSTGTKSRDALEYVDPKNENVLVSG